MFQDGNAPLHPAAVQPRQVPTAGSLSTSTIPSPTTFLSESASTTFVPHAAFSTVTTAIYLGDNVCTAALPAGGIIEFNQTYTLYLEDSVSYLAQCGNQSVFNSDTSNSTVVKDNDPFYTSISPQIYALATSTVVSYILVILIFITPRTFYVGGPSGSAGTSGVGGFRTLFPRSSGRNSSVIGIGRRPLLQKIAALTVAISLTIATADTFNAAEKQYTHGFIEAKSLVEGVVGSMEIRITRVISDTFLWLAQVQTLIRLFPRHKEKVTIKWLGFGLVLCDTVFSVLENWVSKSNRVRPDSFNDAIPALSYLFELSISLIYASCVLYYALSKRRFAFWHAKMRNVCLVALLSVVAVLIPVVFFITDLAQPDIATWGEYIRWVGAAAASVVVWEWVERIEALERDEKKDGILGREIFDGDEMLDMTPSEEGDDDDRPAEPQDAGQKRRSKFWKNVRDLNIDIQPKIQLRKWKKGRSYNVGDKTETTIESGPVKSDPSQITRPTQAVTPISRSDTNSAASTVYAVRYHDPFSPSPAIPEDRAVDQHRQSVVPNIPPAISDESTLTNSTDNTIGQEKLAATETTQAMSTGRQIWQGVANPFKRKRTEPPAEVAAQIAESNSRRSPIDGHLKLRSRLKVFTTTQNARLVGRSQKNRTPLAVTVIPAQPRASHANIETDIADAENLDTDVNETAALASPVEMNNDSGPEFGSLDIRSVPVTFIPAPTRGGRTWSPDDMAHDEQGTSAGQHGVSSEARPDNPPKSSASNAEEPPTIESQRGALTISESPIRSRDANSPNNGRSSAFRRSRNNRGATITSINNRLGSVSPATVSGVRSGTIDSTGPPRSTTNGSSDRQVSE